MPKCPYYPDVRIKRALRKTSRKHVTFATRPRNAEDKNAVAVFSKWKSSYRPHSILPREHQKRTGIVIYFISKPTNQGSESIGVEVCLRKIWCPRKHVDLLEQLPDVGNNPVVRAEADVLCLPLSASKRKKPRSNDCSKRPRKWKVCVGIVGRKLY